MFNSDTRLDLSRSLVRTNSPRPEQRKVSELWANGRLFALMVIAIHFVDTQIHGGKLDGCSRRSLDGSNRVEVVEHAGRVHVRNLHTCKAGWRCPHYNMRRAKEHQRLLQIIIEAGMRRGTALLATGTVPADPEASLDEMLKRLCSARQAFSHKTFSKLKTEFGIIGYAWVLEIVEGDNGWFPHLHYVLISDRRLSAAEVSDACRQWSDLWSAAVRTTGHASNNFTGRELTALEGESAAEQVSSYMTKQNFRRAVLVPERKNSSRDPWQILLDSMTKSDPGTDMKLFAEYIEATRGQRAFQKSVGLAEALGLADGSLDVDLSSRGQRANPEDERVAFTIDDIERFQAIPEAGDRMREAIGKELNFDAGRDVCSKHDISTWSPWDLE